MSRNTWPTRPVLNSLKDLTFIILSASYGKRLKSYGNRSLIRIDGQYLFQKQIDAIRSKFAGVRDIIYVTGYESEKFIRAAKGVRVVENENYETTNVARSIAMGVNASDSSNIFLIHGDILFDSNFFSNFTSGLSSVATDYAGRIGEDKVGVMLEGDYVTNLTFGLPIKFGQAAFLAENELDILKKILSVRANQSFTLFEILSMIVEKGGRFLQSSVPSEATLIELSNSKVIDSLEGKGNGQG